MFNDVVVRNILTLTSDHSAIFLDLDRRSVRRGGRHFKFESAWLVDENCRQVVKQSWSSSAVGTFQHRIERYGGDLWRWGGDHFKKFGRRIQQLRRQLESLRSSRASSDVIQYQGLEKELCLLLTQEEIYWKQWSKQLWLRRGIRIQSIFINSLLVGEKTIISHGFVIRKGGGWMDRLCMLRL